MPEKRIPLPKGHARRQFVIHQDEIFDLLKQGCLVSQIHSIMTDSKKISMSYYTLRSYIVRYSSKTLIIRPINQRKQIHTLDQKLTTPPSNNDVSAKINNNSEPEPTSHTKEAKKLPPAPPKFGSEKISAEDVF